MTRRQSERVRRAMKEIRRGAGIRTPGGPRVCRRRVAEEHARGRAAALRAEGLSWALVAQRMVLPKETCRLAAYNRKKRRGPVENSDRVKASLAAAGPVTA